MLVSKWLCQTLSVNMWLLHVERVNPLIGRSRESPNIKSSSSIGLKGHRSLKHMLHRSITFSVCWHDCEQGDLTKTLLARNHFQTELYACLVENKCVYLWMPLFKSLERLGWKMDWVCKRCQESKSLLLKTRNNLAVQYYLVTELLITAGSFNRTILKPPYPNQM